MLRDIWYLSKVTQQNVQKQEGDDSVYRIKILWPCHNNILTLTGVKTRGDN